MVYDPRSPLGDVVMNPTPPPRIEIIIKRDGHDVGCTTVAAIIATALKEAGMKNVEVKSKDGDFYQVASGALNHPSGTIISQRTCNTAVTIRDENEWIDGTPRGLRK